MTASPSWTELITESRVDYSSKTREAVVMHLKLDWRDISSSQVIAKWGSSRRRLLFTSMSSEIGKTLSLISSMCLPPYQAANADNHLSFLAMQSGVL